MILFTIMSYSVWHSQFWQYLCIEQIPRRKTPRSTKNAGSSLANCALVSTIL